MVTWGRMVFDGAAVSRQLLQLYRDDTDVTPLGWPRYYARVHVPTTANRAILGIDGSKAGTYQFCGLQIEAVTRTTRKPSDWRRHQPQPATQTAAAELTFNGASTYTATNLIPAGARVIGVTSRVTQAITFGTATSYAIWGAVVTNTALDATSGPADFTATSTVNFPTATSVIVAGNGTITSGKLRLTVEYTRPAPPSAA
jgi:hypothetical protein